MLAAPEGEPGGKIVERSEAALFEEALITFRLAFWPNSEAETQEKAYQSLHHYLESYPQSPRASQALVWLAGICNLMDKQNELFGLEQWAKGQGIVVSDHHLVEIRRQILYVMERAHRYPEAIAVAERLMQENPSPTLRLELLSDIAYCYRQSRQFDQALHNLAELAELARALDAPHWLCRARRMARGIQQKVGRSAQSVVDKLTVPSQLTESSLEEGLHQSQLVVGNDIARWATYHRPSPLDASVKMPLWIMDGPWLQCRKQEFSDRVVCLLWIDVSALRIPARAWIIQGWLTLHRDIPAEEKESPAEMLLSGEAIVQICAYRLKDKFVQGLDDAHAMADLSWEALELPALDEKPLRADEPSVTLDVTSPLSEWLRDSSRNTGLAIRLAPTASMVSVWFASPVHLRDLSLRPKLVVQWKEGT